MARKDRTPEAKDVNFPVFVPNTDGTTSIELGKASLKAGTLVIEFRNNLPGVAIQRMIERGVLLGFSFVMLQADEVNEAAQERLAHEEEERAFLEAMTPEERDEYDLALLHTEETEGSDWDKALLDIDENNNEENN